MFQTVEKLQDVTEHFPEAQQVPNLRVQKRGRFEFIVVNADKPETPLNENTLRKAADVTKFIRAKWNVTPAPKEPISWWPTPEEQLADDLAALRNKPLTRDEFHKEHSKEGAPIRNGDLFFYPSGARMSQRAELGQSIPPPKDQVEREKLRLFYHDTVLHRLTEQFHALKAGLHAAAQGAAARRGQNPPDQSQVTELRRLQQQVSKQRDVVDAIKVTLESIDKSQRLSEKAQAEHRAKCDEVAGEIYSIRI